MKLSSLQNNPENPREITEVNFKGLVKSIDEFGDISGIVFNKRTGRLATGHQRKAALLEQYGDLDIIILEEFKKPTSKGTTKVGYVLAEDERINYREVDWSEETEIEANIAANNPNLQGSFIQVKLDSMLQQIKLGGNYEPLRLNTLEVKLSKPEKETPAEFKDSTDIEEEEFEHSCPKCGFEFND